MGLRLEFYIGNSKKITKAMREVDLDLLYNPNVVSCIADLSLHIVPHDLNLLSRQFGKHSRQRPLDLRSYLKVLIDEQDHGLLLVNKKWVQYVANVKENLLGEIVLTWFEEMQNEYPDEGILITEGAKRAVQDLLKLCKEAVQRKEEVLHGWFL